MAILTLQELTFLHSTDFMYAYLDSLGNENEVAGIAGSACNCPVARAINHTLNNRLITASVCPPSYDRYGKVYAPYTGDIEFIIDGNSDTDDDSNLPLPPVLGRLAACIDFETRNDPYEVPVRFVRAALKEIEMKYGSESHGIQVPPFPLGSGTVHSD